MPKEPPVRAFEQIQDKTVFQNSVCPHTTAEWAVHGRRSIIFSFVALIRRLDEAAILEVKLCIHDDVYMNVQRTGRVGPLLYLDGHLFANSAAVTMEPVIISGPEVKPETIFGRRKFPYGDVGRGQDIRHH